MNTESYLKTKILERPCKDNDLTAIVRAESKTEQGEIVDFGYADAESTKSKSAKKILDIARNEALERVKNEAMRDTTHSDKIAADSEAKASIPASQSMTQQTQSQASNATQNPVSVLPWNSQASSAPNKNYAHNPRKTASEKQIDLLLSLSTKKGIHLGSKVQEKYGKSIEALNSPEANALIQELK